MAEDLAASRRSGVWLSLADISVEDLVRLVERRTRPADYPFAAEIQQNVPVYDGAAVRAAEPGRRRAMMAEWVVAMTDGPGIVAFRDAFADRGAVDAVT